MLESTELVGYSAHVVLLNSSLVYRWWLVEDRLTFVGAPRPKMETCMENELSGEGLGEFAHYWFTKTEALQTEEAMMPSGQSTLRQLKMGLLH